MQCLKSIDPDLWLYAMQHESCDMPRFYTTEFEEVTSKLLELNGMTRDSITVDNIRSVYTFLLNLYENL